MHNYFTEIEDVVKKHLDNRGMDKLVLEGEVEAVTKELSDSAVVFVITGFVIKDTLIGETDGPLGSISLASALEKLGKDVVIITDKYNDDMIKACCKIKDIRAKVAVINKNNEHQQCSELIDLYRPSHIIAIERPGRAKDGHCYSMRGESLNDLVPNTDEFFKIAKIKGIKTLAIGDGGNELGMGKIADYVRDNIKKGEKICACQRADHLIVAGVSNWGGHGVVAGLSILNKRKLLHDSKLERSLLEELIANGSVDGCTKKCELTVDGFDLLTNLSIVDELESIIDKNI